MLLILIDQFHAQEIILKLYVFIWIIPEGTILLGNMAQRVTIFLLSPSHIEPQFDDYESIDTLKWKKNNIKMKKKTLKWENENNQYNKLNNI
jgi:hypothetical protein